MELMSYIFNERYILIPALYVLGEIIKYTKLIKDKYIPIILLIVGILISVLMGGFSVTDNVIQGILVVGVTVLTNQMIKQGKKEE